MKSLQDTDMPLFRPVRYVLTDVDDTLTTHGKLYPETLQALWDLHDAEYIIILVTGGSAGWADTYLRQWPIDAVISESGALAYYMNEGKRDVLYHPSIIRSGYKERADRFIALVRSKIPESKLSSDQFCRLFDIAFDHHDERPYMSQEGIDAIKKLCQSEGLSYGVSSIHVNCWFGTYDKLSMVDLFMGQRYGLSPDEIRRESIYCGDSANDIPLFKSFPLSVGVGSVSSASLAAEDRPVFCAEKEGGAGFVEMAKVLLDI